MKKIINGKKYDTDTAVVVKEYANTYNRRDFSYLIEELYRKKTGEYFLHGEGGPASKYAERCGQNEWTGGEGIIPLTEEEARAWAENHMDAEEYEEEFGDVSEDELATDITAVRKSLGLTQQAFADKIGMPKRTLEDWEGGRRTPPEWVLNLVIEKARK